MFHRAFGGGLCEKDGINYRKNFDKWFKSTWTTVKIPGKGSVYDYFVNAKTQKFQPWAELVTDVDYDSSQPMNTVFVPTAETSSLRFFLDLMIDLRKPIMFVGGAGVGKTQLVKGKLGSLPEEVLSLCISFNYFTGKCWLNCLISVLNCLGSCGVHLHAGRFNY